MVRKIHSPGKNLKQFGNTPNQTKIREPLIKADGSKGSWWSTRVQMLNIVLFTFGGMVCFVQYFLHQAPLSQSVFPGLGFVAMLILYLYLLRLRQSKNE